MMNMFCEIFFLIYEKLLKINKRLYCFLKDFIVFQFCANNVVFYWNQNFNHSFIKSSEE